MLKANARWRIAVMTDTQIIRWPFTSVEEPGDSMSKESPTSNTELAVSAVTQPSSPKVAITRGINLRPESTRHITWKPRRRHGKFSTATFFPYAKH